jgi:hypothetical protein
LELLSLELELLLELGVVDWSLLLLLLELPLGLVEAPLLGVVLEGVEPVELVLLFNEPVDPVLMLGVVLMEEPLP